MDFDETFSPDQIPANGRRTSLYVHVPFCSSKCPYCNFYSKPFEEYDVQKLVKALLKELSFYPLGSHIQTVYIGGGSPSVLPAKDILLLVSAILEHCDDVVEFSIEMNPGQVEKDTLLALNEAGVNRVSFGVQSFLEQELKILGRNHSVSDVYNSLKWSREAGFVNLSIDLIFAIPGSSLGDWKRNLRMAVECPVKHISAYSLTYERETEFYSLMEKGAIEAVEEELDRDMYEAAIEEFAKAGFEQYEISNFAKPEFECLHNLTYWKNEPYIGIGPSAGSYYDGRRYTNISDIDKYIKQIEKGKQPVGEIYIPNEIERACETAVLNLRTIKGVDIPEFYETTGFDFLEMFKEPLLDNINSGLLEREGNRVHLTKKSLPIANVVLSDFSFI